VNKLVFLNHSLTLSFNSNKIGFLKLFTIAGTFVGTTKSILSGLCSNLSYELFFISFINSLFDKLLVMHKLIYNFSYSHP